ncbi:MAG: hypothetical protein R3B72_37655 [Polyangiaceae bacterium]
MSVADPYAITVLVTDVLESLGLRYLIGGSLASSLHGTPRSTNDADLVAEIPGRLVEDLVSALEDRFYIDADMIRDAIARGASFNLIHYETAFKIDVFVLTRDDLLQEEMRRRESHGLPPSGERSAWFASAEDTILQKLDWYRKGAGISERQWRDLAAELPPAARTGWLGRLLMECGA